MKKIIIYLLLATTYFAFLNMSCDDSIMPNVDLGRIELDNFNNAEKEMVSAETSLPKEAYVMGVRCFYKYHDKDNESQIRLSDENRDKITLSNVESVSIICNSKFNDKHPLGSDITSLFTKSEKLLLKEDSHDYSYFLILSQAPDAGTHSFKVIYKLIDNKGTVEADTKPIEFL